MVERAQPVQGLVNTNLPIPVSAWSAIYSAKTL